MNPRLRSALRLGIGVVCVATACDEGGTVVSAYPGLGAPVEVRRDDRGIPHVYAHGGDDALFALGYETARDRLFELDLNRRRATGREAEIFGPASLADDQLARAVGFEALGQADAEDLSANDPEVYRAISAYAAGITAYMNDASAGRNGAALPPEYADLDPSYRPEPWKVADTLALLKAELFLLAVHPASDLLSFAIMQASASGPDVFRDLYRPDPLEPVYITPGFPESCTTTGAALMQAGGQSEHLEPRETRALLELARGIARWSRRARIGTVAASNNWALCGQLTASGHPMLANDPHLDIELPTNLYEMHVESDAAARGGEEPLRMAGFGIPGAPAIVLGHNDRIAWGVTTVEADIADSYLETTQGDAVVFRGQVVPMQVRTETIRVRKNGQPASEYEEIAQTVRVVPHHGPVISDAVPSVKLLLGDRAISVKWLGFGVTHEARAFYELSRAASYADFQSALNHFEAGLLNFVYAGTDGDIGYYPHSVYPIRARLDPMNPPYGVVPGGGDYEWTGGRIPDECIPQLHDPGSCRVFSANNDPAAVTAGGDVLGARFYLGGTFDYGLRARRIQDRLDALAAGGATADDFESMQGDVHSGLAPHFLPHLLAAASSARLSKAAQALAAVLTSWDGEDGAGEVGPTVFYAWYSQLLVDVFADDLPLTFADVATDDRVLAPTLAHLLAGQSTPSKHDYLNGKSAEDVMVGALEKAALSIPAALGSDPAEWTWGSAHTQTFDHPLGGRYDLGPVPMGGGLSTLYDARYSPTVNGNPVVQPDVNEAPNARIVVELLPGAVTMRSILATGESGVVGTPHYADQMASWLAARDLPSPFAHDDVVAHTVTLTTFPAGFPGH